MKNAGRASYGSVAKCFEGSFADEDPVVIFDQTGAAEALRDCAARRFRGEPFLVRPILQRDFSIRSDAIAPSIFSSFRTLDERRIALEQAFFGTLQVNQNPLHAMPGYSPPVLRLMSAAVRLADAIVVSSQAERRRVQETLDVDPMAVTLRLADRAVPRPPEIGPRAADGILIWAPHLPGDACAMFAVALSELRLPLLAVAASAPVDYPALSWFPPERAAEALARAKLIVDANAYGADAASALGSWGAPIVSDVESGAAEQFDFLRSYDRRRFSSIFEAAVSALGAPAPRARSAAGELLRLPDRPILQNGPLVSVLIPTLDRPAMLRQALQSIERQSYRNIETVVVVDGGPRLDALAGEFPNVRFVHMPENNPVVSCNTLFAEARGEFVTFLNDDDLYFPNHVAELVTALERSGASVAHGDVLTAYLRGADGRWDLYGFESNMSRATNASAFLVSNQIGMTSCMFRRRCIPDNAPFDASVPFCRDYALWLRLATEHDFVHVERITSCYTIRNGGAQQQSTQLKGEVDGHMALYQRYPVPDRPMIQQQRAQVLQAFRQGRLGLQNAPAVEIAPVRWPLWEKE